MKYSHFFGKTTYNKQAGSEFVSHQLLTRGGFIAESVAGRYFFLPLGWRVHEKIKAIVKDEMDKTGAQEMLTPTLHPLELWEETNRTDTVGFELMTLKDQRGAEFALGGTAEEMFVDATRKFTISYRDLPFNVYQFSNKFRDELRARGGLLRVREFIMKDAYSFHASEEDFQKEYEVMAKAYFNMLDRMELKAVKVLADNGYIGGEYCHEYQVESEIGEGRFFVSEDGEYIAHEDVAKFVLEDVNPDEDLKEMEIIEQPEWVQTMEDNQKHYGKDARFFLKNVVYTNIAGDIIIATIRGDLEVNKTKLAKLLDMVGQLIDATDEDLAAIGTKSGYVHSWGHQFIEPRKTKDGKRDAKIIYVADNSLTTVQNFIGGQKEDATDSINVNYGRDFEHELVGDIAMAQDGFLSQDNHGKLIEKKGIEVGNIFQLGYHYSKKMKDAVFVDSDGKEKPFYMGCYGFGIGRTLATVVEKHHDDRGIIWPASIAPFAVHLVSLSGGEEQAQKVYEQLLAAGIEVLWDDRDESPGTKFTDADLIGCPIRLVVSKRTGQEVEWKLRKESDSQQISLEEAINRLQSM